MVKTMAEQSTMKRYLRVLCILLAMAASGCTGPAVEPVDTFVVGFQDSRVRNMSLEELDERGIWYERVDGNAIRFRPEDLDVITSIVEGFSYEVLPPDRSVNYVEPIQKEFLKRLDEAGIEYEVIRYGDLGTQPERGAFHTVVWPAGQDAVEWIVWSAEDADFTNERGTPGTNSSTNPGSLPCVYM